MQVVLRKRFLRSVSRNSITLGTINNIYFSCCKVDELVRKGSIVPISYRWSVNSSQLPPVPRSQGSSSPEKIAKVPLNFVLSARFISPQLWGFHCLFRSGHPYIEAKNHDRRQFGIRRARIISTFSFVLSGFRQAKLETSWIALLQSYW